MTEHAGAADGAGAFSTLRVDDGVRHRVGPRNAQRLPTVDDGDDGRHVGETVDLVRITTTQSPEDEACATNRKDSHVSTLPNIAPAVSWPIVS